VLVHGGPANFKLGLYRTSRLMELADHFGSDKGSNKAWSLEYCAHGYAEIYDLLFARWRADCFALLEIGLHTPSTHGGVPTDAPSLRLWGEYFPRARLYGFDINDFRHVSVPRARILCGDQGSSVDIAALQHLLADDPPRAIIDDGSHRSPHQQSNLASLIPYLEPGGAYVIEDLCWQPFQEGQRTIDVLREWGSTGRLKSPFISEREAAAVAECVKSVCIAAPHRCAMAILTRKHDHDSVCHPCHFKPQKRQRRTPHEVASAMICDSFSASARSASRGQDLASRSSFSRWWSAGERGSRGRGR
jgi:hypothetical protein